jgi:hypothetical protein
VFATERGLNRDMYIATRASEGVTFGTPTLLYDSGAEDDDPFLTPDLLTLWHDTRLSTTDLFVTTRATTTSPWSVHQPLTALNTTGLDDCPEVTPDLLTMYFSSEAPGTKDVMRASRASTTAAFGAPTVLPELSSGVEDVCPTLGPDGTIYFSSNRGPNFQIWFARPLGAGFMPPSVFVDASTVPATDFDPFITRDGRTFVFSSDRQTSGDQDLYMMQRECQ